MLTREFGSLFMHFAGAGLLRSIRPVVIALLIVAQFTANVSAAVIPSNMTPPEVRQSVHETFQQIRPALYKPVGEVTPSALQMMLDAGKLTPVQYQVFHQIYVQGEVPPGHPEIEYMLGLPEAEQFAYSLQALQASGELSAQEVKLFTELVAAPNEEVRSLAVKALESGSYGALATAILQITVDLTNIDASTDLQTCEATPSSLRAQGFLKNFGKWLGGLAKSVLRGALIGAWIGGELFGRWGRVAGAIIGGVVGGAKYISDTTGNGFMAGPNGEDCTGWPKPF